MNRRDIVIGFVVLAILAGVVYWRQNREEEDLSTQQPQTLSVEDRIEEKFNVEIPQDVDKAELKDASGGNASGLATRKWANGKFEHSVLADLPDPESGKFYQGWLVKSEEGDEDYSIVSTGRMQLAKGGWSLQFSSGIDYSEYAKVKISQEEISDRTPEKTILEGDF